MASDANDQLLRDLASMEADAGRWLTLEQKYGPVRDDRRAAFDAVRRHAKGLKVAAVALRQQLRVGQ